MFYWIYFAMTGMHALHMIIGAGLLTFLIIYSLKGVVLILSITVRLR